MPPFSCPPPVSAACSGWSTRSSPGRSMWSVLGALGDPSVVVDSRAAASRRGTARHGTAAAPLTHYRAPEAASPLVIQRPGSAGMDPAAPRGPRCPREQARNGFGTAAAGHRPGRERLPELGPPPLPAERGVSAGERCASSAPRTAPALPPRPGPAAAVPGVSPGSGVLCSAPAWPPPRATLA